MIREVNILDAKDIQELCKDELGYNVDIKTVKTQIEKLSIDYEHHIIAVYEDKKQVRLLVLFMQRCMKVYIVILD